MSIPVKSLFQHPAKALFIFVWRAVLDVSHRRDSSFAGTRWGRPPPRSEHSDLIKAGRRARRWCRVDFGQREWKSATVPIGERERAQTEHGFQAYGVRRQAVGTC